MDSFKFVLFAILATLPVSVFTQDNQQCEPATCFTDFGDDFTPTQASCAKLTGVPRCINDLRTKCPDANMMAELTLLSRHIECQNVVSAQHCHPLACMMDLENLLKDDPRRTFNNCLKLPGVMTCIMDNRRKCLDADMTAELLLLSMQMACQNHLSTEGCHPFDCIGDLAKSLWDNPKFTPENCVKNIGVWDCIYNNRSDICWATDVTGGLFLSSMQQGCKNLNFAYDCNPWVCMVDLSSSMENPLKPTKEYCAKFPGVWSCINNVYNNCPDVKLTAKETLVTMGVGCPNSNSANVSGLLLVALPVVLQALAWM